MAELKDTAIRLYRKYFGSPSAAEDQAAGVHTVLTGETAVAVSEAAMAQTVVLGGGIDEIESGLNVFGRPVSTMDTEGARGAFAAAIGLGLSGKRATVFVDGQDIAGAQDLLFSASGRHLPLVIHLTNKSVASHGGAAGTGHEGFHLSTDSGCFTLFAANVQEAVDFTYIARRVAEQCLVPGIVAMDAEQTAGSVQDVHLLAPAQVRNFIGPADGIVTVPTVAQRLLFGRQRRRVPRWHDVDRPALQGALYDRNSFALGALGRQTFFDDYLAECLNDTLERFARLTGRSYSAVSGYRLGDAETVFVVQGSAVETAKSAVDYLAGQKVRAGVLAVSSLRPLPAAEIADAIGRKSSVVILERIQMPAGGTGPLTREIRVALDSSEGRCHAVSYGLGGAPLRVADLALVPDQIRAGNSRFSLGMDFTRDDQKHPKREVLLDTLERAYPGLERSGVRERGDVDIPLAQGLVGFAVARKRDGNMAALAGEIGTLLHQMDGGMVRNRSGAMNGQWGGDASDYLVWSDGELLDPGDDAAVDVLIVTEKYRAMSGKDAARLRQDGIVVIAGPARDRLSSLLSAEFLAAITDKGARVFHAADETADEMDEVEFALGAIFSGLIESGKIALKERKVLSTRRDILNKFPAELRDRLLAAFQQGLEQCATVEPSEIAVRPSKRWDKQAPATVRALGRNDNEFDSLPRFWDQVGVLYHDGEADELTVDPYFATGTVAPLSSTFRNLADTRSEIPVFDPETCTGCGKCWVACPDSAIGPVAISPAELINTGIKAGSADALRQVANQLSSRIAGQAKKGETAPTANAVLRGEFEWLKEKMSMTPERAETLEGALDKAATALGDLPLAVTDPLYKDAENVKKDSGEFLSLVINPDVCKGCGICVDQCEPEALSFVEQDEEVILRAEAMWNVWAETPDTPAATIERLMESGGLDPLAALTLSRYCLHAMAGGDSAEPGSGEKIAMRMILAGAEFHGQPLLNKFAWDARELAKDLVTRIQGMLASAMPGDDLDLLNKTLEKVGSSTLDLKTLAGDVEFAIEDHTVDANALRRLTRLAGELDELQETISRGSQGLGRARFGLAITPGTVAQWAGEFPYNAFQSPVMIDLTGETAQMAAGLLEGHLRDTCESIALLHKARLELDQSPGIDFERTRLDQLRWQDLTEEERRFCPPLIVVGNDEALAGPGLSQVLWLLSSELPVKIVALADLDFGVARKADGHGELSAPHHHDPRTNLALLALGARNAYVAQTSIADFEHIQASVSDALEYAGPALIRVHVPSPARHGVPANAAIRQAELAVTSRAHPLFTYDPRKEGVYGTRISLDGNPEPESDWLNGESGPVTPADWALTERRFQGCFTPMYDEDGPGMPLAEFLALDAAGRSGKTPLVETGEADEARRYLVGPGLIGVIDDLQGNWQFLKELAGVSTPFTEKVWTEAREGVLAEHQAEVDALKTDYEEKINQLTSSVQSEMASRIRGQLMNLVRLKSVDAQADAKVDE